ncbi:hypothetical protein CcI49_35700 [Frankia sp. CcI49]|uniref:hypothetical protein n=1 Tax=unclassified Frankia TaxID=2632575 RepID=UPI0006CA24E5|nr:MULTISPECIES: hypothetical protein [unclassified Frankia]KPM53655.1 hypothetical protein ACG83_23855 [Frankia sp. R43]ONH51416.1 hypothetical protein CcI49_35700 [Frankia sp. CcI49]
MAKKSLRSPLVAALVLGTALAVTLPGTAYAATTITVRTATPASGPGTANTENTSDANCRSGGDTDDVVSGVGILQTIGTAAAQSNLHVKGIVPFNGTSEYTLPNSYSDGVVGTNATQARAVGATGGSGGGFDAAFGSTPYAMCLDPGGTITGTQIVMDHVAGPTAPGTIDLAVATCPEGTRLLGGGARTLPGTVGPLKPIVSYPTFLDGTGPGTHDNGAIAAADGEINPDSWAAGGSYGGMSTSSSNVTYAYAICSGEEIDVSGVTVTVRYDDSSGPTSNTDLHETTVGCDEEDGTLISGGAGISGGDITTSDFTAPGTQGDHLNGSYPSDSSGNPLTTSPAHWTSLTHTGGSGSTGATTSHVWALCLTGN